MYKAALILGFVALFVTLGATLLSPVCTPCTAVVLGAGVGYLAGVFEKPRSSNASASTGAISGAVGGIGAAVGLIAGTTINALIVGPEGAQQLLQQLNLPSTGPSLSQGYWFGVVGSGLCFGVLDVLLMAAFGALGGFLWWQIRGKNANPASPLLVS